MDAAEARYILAQCYLRDGAAQEAVTALTQLRESAPEDSPFRDPALFLLGEAQSGLGLWPQAEASYAAYRTAAPELSSLIWQRIGKARREQGDATGASAAYNEALKASPDWTNTVASRRALADLALARNDTAGAVAEYDALRGSSKNSWAAEMQLLAGNAAGGGRRRGRGARALAGRSRCRSDEHQRTPRDGAACGHGRAGR